jgi:phosphosulfolactate phosphohydrolase-like enzyme
MVKFSLLRYKLKDMDKDITIFWPWELPEKIEGIAVVIDLWAATTNIAQMLLRGAEKIYIANGKNILSTVKSFPQAIPVGESTDSKLEGFFRCSNSIKKVAKFDVKGKTVIYMTNNGTRVIEKALKKGAECVVTASYVNLAAVAEYIALRQGCDSKNPWVLSNGSRSLLGNGSCHARVPNFRFNSHAENVNVDPSSLTVHAQVKLNSGALAHATRSSVRLSHILKPLVTILPAGEWTVASIPDKKSLEDYLCADALKKLLSGQTIDRENYFQRSKEFILSHYEATSPQSLTIAHKLNSLSVVPVCRLESDPLRRAASRICIKPVKNDI